MRLLIIAIILLTLSGLTVIAFFMWSMIVFLSFFITWLIAFAIIAGYYTCKALEKHE